MKSSVPINSVTQMKWTNSLKARRLDSPWIAISLCKQWFPPWLYIGITWKPWLALSIWARLRHFYVIGMGSTCGQDTQASPYPEVLWARWRFPALRKSFSWSVFQQLKSVTSLRSQCLELTLVFTFILRHGKTFNSQQQDTLLPKWKGPLWACVWCPGEGIVRRGPLRTPDLPQERDPHSTVYMLTADKVLTSLGTEILQAQSRDGEKKMEEQRSPLWCIFRSFIHVLGVQCGY